ncbi:MAG: LPS assembly protein LptD [Granulosicoccus sp.]|nr:LPS assembly protein LptD [Granulosicoccus sp.]
MHLISSGLPGALPIVIPSLLAATLVTGNSMAAQCPVPRFVYEPGAFDSTPGLPVLAEADRVISEQGLVTLEGNTTIRYQGREISADNASYDPTTGEVSVNGALKFLGEGFQLQSNEAFIDLDDDLFRTGQSEYELDLKGKRATGTAASMARMADGHFVLQKATYSTCPPGDLSWYVRADSIDLDTDEGIGTARDLRLVFKGVPLMALPAFSFPISDRRKTGFLAPVLARGESTGLELHLPWYWNIRPDLDATFTPRFMTRRGTQLQSEIRYLTRQGLWTLDHEYLKDRVNDGDSRYFTQLLQKGSFSPDVSTTIVARRVSDKDYLEDLGDSLQVASITHLEQRADLNYELGRVKALARLQSFQTVDENIVPEDRPHRRLPQLKAYIRSEPLPLGLRSDVEGEFVYFDKDDAVTGTRVDLHPRLSLPVVRDAWFFKPSVAHRFTYYSLNNTSSVVTDNRLDSSSSRSLDTLSVDTGVFFDRLLDDEGSIQTLEPRLFYLKVPYRDQSDIPVFDSSAFDFNISQLFRENRFSGGDRVADANQLSMALTTRMIDGVDGRERFRASIGQIRYFDDRRVTLPPADTIGTRNYSDLVGELFTTLSSNWVGKGSIQWNPDEDQTIRGSLSLGYRPGPNRILNVTHRVVNSEARDEKTEQIDLSGLWKIGDSWRIASRWNYSLDSDRSIETLLGLEYDSCCWAVRFAARRYIADNGEDHDTSAYFQLVLKGLAPLGQNYGALLENAILGYRDDVQ